MKRSITYRELIQELLEQELDKPVRFVWNGEDDYELTFSNCTVEIDSNGKPYILLDKKKKE